MGNEKVGTLCSGFVTSQNLLLLMEEELLPLSLSAHGSFALWVFVFWFFFCSVCDQAQGFEHSG